MSFYNHITTVEIAERGALSAMPIGTADATTDGGVEINDETDDVLDYILVAK